MSLCTRLLLVGGMLGAALAGQSGLNWHMRSGVELGYAHLRKPITDLPMTVVPLDDKSTPEFNASWQGIADAQEDDTRKKLPFTPEEMLSRYYVQRQSALTVNLYMVYSRQADDRKHHPEVCIRDGGGAQEDLGARKLVYVDAERKRAIQRFRFRTSATQHTTVYYWHYTLPPVPRAGATALQVMHQRLSGTAPSITVQVSTSAEPAQFDALEQGFLTSLEQTFRERHLPEGAVMGCNRMPVALLVR